MEREFYFVFPQISVRSYRYSCFFYNFRKQLLYLRVNSSLYGFSNLSFTRTVDPESYFCDYTFFLAKFSRFPGIIRNRGVWCGVYRLFFFSFLTFLDIFNRYTCYTPVIAFKNFFNYCTVIFLFKNLMYMMMEKRYFYIFKVLGLECYPNLASFFLMFGKS